jgi:hypothetical protein
MHDLFARQMLGQRAAHRLAPFASRLNGRAARHRFAFFEVFQQQLELRDLMVELLRRAAKLHPPQHGELRPILFDLQPGAG